MGKTAKQKRLLTKAKECAENGWFGRCFSGASAVELAFAESEGMVLSPKDAEEFRAYKRKKKIDEIMSAMSKSEASLLSGDDAAKVCERALRLKQAAVKTTTSRLIQARELLKNSRVKLDVVIGGTGETLTRVKAYEARLAVRMQARELTFVPSRLSLEHCRFDEVRRELRALRRVAGKTTMKVWVDAALPPTTLSRAARIASEIGANYFCVGYYDGCEKLRYEMTGGCKLGVCDVETLESFKKMILVGAGRVTTECVWEIYNEWMKEADKIPDYRPIEHKAEERAVAPTETKEPERTDAEKLPPMSGEGDAPKISAELRCSAEGSDLKFL